VTSLLLALGAGIVSGSPAGATANRGNTGGAVTIYSTGSDEPVYITAGPDGALWFTNYYNLIGRITTSGVVTTYTDPSGSGTGSITAGPDGALWFINGINSIGRITTAGVVTTYTDPGIANPQEITAGPDGALWFTNAGNNSIGRITTSGVVTNYTDPTMSGVQSITAGPDGALWFTNGGNHSIGRITTGGIVTDYTLPGIDRGPIGGITAGPDGALWFDNFYSIGRMTTAGVVTTYTDPGITDPQEITAGPDGALWFTNWDYPPDTSVSRITTAGVVTNYTGPGIYSPYGITTGPDGALWFTNQDNNTIGRITTPPYAFVSSSFGTPGTSVTMTGGGFSAGETVRVKYVTGLAKPTGVTVCSGVAADGQFSCTGRIPPADKAGPLGVHSIKAIGLTSGTRVTATFTLIGVWGGTSERERKALRRVSA